MASSPIILCTFFIFLFHLQSTRGNKQFICNTLRCGDIDIKFPFGLKGSNQDRLCWYYPIKSFHISCINQTQPIVNIPGFGNLIVKSINYESRSIQVNDPEGCLPKRFLHKWNLSESPFILNPSIYSASLFNLTFIRCLSNVTDPSQFPLTPISCLSDNKNNYSVIASWSQPIMLSQRCQVMSQALFPVQVMVMPMPMLSFWGDLTDDLHLLWTQPNCINYARSAQDCAFSNQINKTLQVACYPRDSTKGLSRSAKYGIAIGAGIPGLLCLIGVSCFICGKIRMQTHRRSSTDLPLTISLEPIPFVMGLDVATIEKYPKTLIGESGRLLKPSDNTCAICLCEYEPKETLRSIPECNHYFHADCIDEWLKLNATCPLCRKSPGPSSTPSFFSSSSTSSPQ